MKTELKKLHTEIGNIILQEIKRFNERPAYKGGILKQDLLAWMDETEQRETGNQATDDADQYRKLKFMHDEALESNQKLNQAVLSEIYRQYEDILTSGCSDAVKGRICHKLAQMEFYGEGIDKDLDLAKKHCMNAMAYGSRHSYALMAKICFAKKNITDGMNALYSGSADGDALSQYLLGIELIRGVKIVRDKDEGYRTIIVSASQGFQPAIDYLEHHNAKGYSEAQMNRVSSIAWGHFHGHSVSNEISGYLHNDDSIHHLQDRIETEIEAYLNNKKTPARRMR